MQTVNQILHVHKELTAAKTPTDKAAIQRQLHAMDGRIDRLVYDLYALMEEEIGIVEEGTQ